MHITGMQKEFVKILKLKKSGEYHDLYVQSDTSLLANVFENFRNVCLEICELAKSCKILLDPAKFLSAPGSAW